MTKAKNWAIVVGVNAYKNIGRLEYANRDAEAMHDFFVKAKFDRVFWFADGITLPSSSEQHSTDPTSSDLVDFLHDRFSTKVPPLDPGDNCWFFFAGHGKRIDDCDYLLPIDYNPRLADHEKRAISVNFVRERLLKSGADNVILLLDACRTEGDRADGLGIGDVQPGAITIFSCQRNRKAYEIEALRQGAFTAALLEALQMPGERNCATVERLDLYLQRRVPEICRQYNKPEQIPITHTESLQKYYLILLPEFATDKDVALLRSEALEAEVEETLEIAEQLWIRVIAATQGQDLRALQAYSRVQAKKNNQRSLLPVITITNNLNHHQATDHISGDRVMTGGMITNHYTEARSVPIPASRLTVQPAQVRLQPKAKEPEKSITIETIEFLFIKGGKFMMGAPDNEESATDAEKPQHLVTVPDFYMSKYLITQAQWKTIADLKPGLTPEPSCFKGDAWKLPVDNVSWHDVFDFCDRLSKHSNEQIQLPSEAQWEYACRAGTTTPFYFGETIDPSQANYQGNDIYGNGKKGEYRNKTTAVDTFKPNPFGLHDMHGNLWEWCMDSPHKNYDGAPTDGSSWGTSNRSHVLRGGCWTREPWRCRSAHSHNSPAGSAIGNFGFRPILIPRT